MKARHRERLMRPGASVLLWSACAITMIRRVGDCPEQINGKPL
jgi:hypothetical protein